MKEIQKPQFFDLFSFEIFKGLYQGTFPDLRGPVSITQDVQVYASYALLYLKQGGCLT